MMSTPNRIASFQAFLFDLDGVLVDSYECWRNLVNDALRSRGKATPSKEDFNSSWGQGPEADQKMFFPEWTVQQVLRFYEIDFPRHVKWARRRPGIEDLLAALRQAGKKIAVASNSPGGIIRALLHETELTSLIDVSVGVEEVKAGKPAPDLLLAVLRKLKVPAHKACYVGDSIFDEQAARAAGVFFIGYRRAGDFTIQTFDALLGLLSRGDELV